MSIIESNVIEFPFGGSRKAFSRKTRAEKSEGRRNPADGSIVHNRREWASPPRAP
jgi:hypothetical protein